MNRTKIEWCDYTWNPVTGCQHSCSYCYAKQFAERGLGEYSKYVKGQRFTPNFHIDRLEEPMQVKKPSRIFVCSMGDLFGSWVTSGWINDVLSVAAECLQHTFIFLTKNPARLKDYAFSDNSWIGTSIENQEAAEKRVPLLLEAKAAVRFISVEPLLGSVDFTMLARQEQNPTWIDGKPAPWTFYDDALTGFKAHKAGGWYGPKVDWVIIGRQTGRRNLPLPDPKWVTDLVGQCNAAGVPVWMKNSLADVTPPGPSGLIQQWPKVGEAS
jgi:protein gp37